MSSCNDRDYGDGLYIEGTVEDTLVVFTTDTGASKTIVSSRIFNRLRESEKPKLTGAIGLRGAGGMPIKVMGRGAFIMQLGPVKRLQEAIVANIEDDVLLMLLKLLLLFLLLLTTHVLNCTESAPFV